MGKKKKLSPSKVIITMGEKITNTQFSGPVSAVNMINAIIHLTKDIQTVAGMPPSGSLAIVCERFGFAISKIEPNETMRASKSEATANKEDTEES